MEDRQPLAEVLLVFIELLFIIQVELVIDRDRMQWGAKDATSGTLKR